MEDARPMALRELSSASFGDSGDIVRSDAHALDRVVRGRVADDDFEEWGVRFRAATHVGFRELPDRLDHAASIQDRYGRWG